MSRPIIIVGMGRSGTSLVASLVHRWGAFADEARLTPPGRDNSAGYWEHAPLVEFNDRLLAAVSASVSLPPVDEDYPILRAMAMAGAFRERAQQLIESMTIAGQPWLWKDPRLAVLLPFWQQFWGHDAIYVVAIRHPCEVARSLGAAGSSRPLSASLLLWQRSIMQLFKDMLPQAATLVISYNNLLTDPDRQCLRLCQFLNHACGVSRSDETEIKARQMRAAVMTDLWHQREDDDSGAARFLTIGQQRLFALLDDLASDRPIERGMIEACELFPGWREYLLTCRAFSNSLKLIDSQKRKELVSMVSRSNRHM
jgi:hypothetical protein